MTIRSINRIYRWGIDPNNSLQQFPNTGNTLSDIFKSIKVIDGIHPFYYTFYKCTDLTGTIEFKNLKSIKASEGLKGAFSECSGITSISFPKLTTIGERGMEYTFNKCVGITGTVSFPKLTTIGERGMNSTFYECTGITGTVSFPSLTTSGVSITDTTASTNPFYRCFYKCTGITALHFPSSFSTYSSYLSKEVLFGGTTTTYCNANLQILFDL